MRQAVNSQSIYGARLADVDRLPSAWRDSGHGLAGRGPLRLRRRAYADEPADKWTL